MLCPSVVRSVPCAACMTDQMQLTALIYLCSRTTGGPTIRKAILGFLDAYPTPSAVLGASDKELEVCIGPLGLQEVRRKALQRMSHDFFAMVGFALAGPPLNPSAHASREAGATAPAVLKATTIDSMHAAHR